MSSTFLVTLVQHASGEPIDACAVVAETFKSAEGTVDDGETLLELLHSANVHKGEVLLQLADEALASQARAWADARNLLKTRYRENEGLSAAQLSDAYMKMLSLQQRAPPTMDTTLHDFLTRA